MTERKPITWTNEQRKLSDLIPWEHNPKQLTTKQGEHISTSIERFGFAVPFLIAPDNSLYDGHQRQYLMQRMSEYGPDATVDVRVASRPLTDDERRELVIRLRENQADWDFDLLGNLYDVDELQEWGFPEWRLAELTNLDDVEFPEYDESAADGVEYLECPECGHKWPK